MKLNHVVTDSVSIVKRSDMRLLIVFTILDVASAKQLGILLLSVNIHGLESTVTVTPLSTTVLEHL